MFRFLSIDHVSSTNDYARQLGIQGENNLAVIAEQQTKGKGRLGRSFSSRKGNGLYMSLLFQPKDLSMVPIQAALSVQSVLAEKSRDPVWIKWPNDILVQCKDRFKKVCGILCESFTDKDKIYVVCGIGINLFADFPEELREIATCLAEHTDRMQTPQILGREVTEAFTRFLSLSRDELLERYQKRLKNLNHEVRVLKGAEEITGRCTGINQNGELLVVTSDGREMTVHSGEVSIRDNEMY